MTAIRTRLLLASALWALPFLAWAATSPPQGHTPPPVSGPATGGEATPSAPQGVHVASYSDTAFLSAMIVHHEAAVDMANTVLKTGQDPLVKQWAETIIQDQNAEIDQMRSRLNGLGGEDRAAAQAMGTAMHGMMTAPGTGNPDRDFVTMMIDHHAGALDMAIAALTKSNDTTIVLLALKIIQTQANDIASYRQWLKKTEKN